MIRTHVRPIIGRDIPIGRKGENLARAVDFSDIIAEIKKDYGDGGKIVVLVKRPNEDVPYPAAVIDESDGLTWTPTETDTAIVGRGNAEVDYYVDDVLVKSVLFTTYTHDSIGVSGDTPEPGYDYMKQLFDALEKVGTGIVSVDMNKDSSITFHMSDGTEYTTEPLKGADGDPGADGEPGVAGKDGVSPTVSTSEIDGGTRVTITDGTGEHTFDVMNGLDGGEAATPTIGDNGNWFINGQDTGKPSRGETGANGTPGDKGDPGPAGPAGPEGPKGPEGPAGPAGADGATGKNGENGAPGADGKDGVSPTVKTDSISGGTRVTITDATGEHAFDVLNGKNGGEAATPAIGDNGNWYINGVDTGKPSRGETGATGAKGEPGETGANGANGKNGADGVSPTVATSAIEGGTRVTITDASGAHAFDVMNGTDGADGNDGAPGADGKDGAAGANGADGFSPTVNVADGDGTHTVTITDKDGAHVFTINDGKNGADGAKGAPGADGKNGADGAKGADGVSPTVATTAIEGGTHVTITDASGAHAFDVLNGADGAKGADGATGPAGADGFSPTVATTAIDNGTRVTITDASGAHTFDVLNGTGGGGSTPETFQIPFASLISIVGTNPLELGNRGTDFAGIDLAPNPSQPPTNTTPATVSLNQTTGAVTIDFDAVLDTGTGQPVPFGSIYSVEAGEYSTGQWSSALPVFVDLSGGASDENTMRLNGMRIEGVSVYLDGVRRAEYSPVITWEPLMSDPTKTMYSLMLAIKPLDYSSTVKKGDRVHVKIRGHIAPALA